VSYLNEEGDEIEEELYDFKARMFLHEMDHIDGRTMAHWRLSEGNIDVIDSEKDNYKNLRGVIKYSKLALIRLILWLFIFCLYIDC
jgi:Polypeptide deformylase